MYGIGTILISFAPQKIKMSDPKCYNLLDRKWRSRYPCHSGWLAMVGLGGSGSSYVTIGNLEDNNVYTKWHISQATVALIEDDRSRC